MEGKPNNTMESLDREHCYYGNEHKYHHVGTDFQENGAYHIYSVCWVCGYPIDNIITPDSSYPQNYTPMYSCFVTKPKKLVDKKK